MDFPNIMNPVYPLEETHQDFTRKMQVENHTLITRPSVTKKIKKWKLTWKNMTSSDLNKLRNFYDNETLQSVYPFYWTHPKDPGNDYSEKKFLVRFESAPTFRLVRPGRYEVEVNIEEA